MRYRDETVFLPGNVRTFRLNFGILMLKYISAVDLVVFFCKSSIRITSHKFQKTVTITFPVDKIVFAVFCVGLSLEIHCSTTLTCNWTLLSKTINY